MGVQQAFNQIQQGRYFHEKLKNITIRGKKDKEKNSFYKLPLFVNYVLQNSSIQEKTKLSLKKWEVRES